MCAYEYAARQRSGSVLASPLPYPFLLSTVSLSPSHKSKGFEALATSNICAAMKADGLNILCVVTLLWSAHLCASTVVVTPADDWELLLSTAESGSRVEFLPGRYTGRCTAQITSKQLLLVGVGGKALTSLDCQNNGRHLHVTGGSSVTLEGLTLVGGNTTGDGGCVLVEEASELRVVDSHLSGCTSAG